MVDAPVNEQQTGAEAVVWDLSVFYNALDDPRIDADMEKIRQMADDFAAKYRGRVAELDPKEMMDALKEADAMRDLSGRIYSFASLTYSTDTNDPRAGAMIQKVSEFGAMIGQKTVFFELEWNALDDETARRFIESPVLAEYAHDLESDRRYKPYQLSEPEEQIIMEKDVTGRSAWARFFTQLTSALRFDFDGEKLNQSQIMVKLRDEDREVRQKAAKSITEVLSKRKMELTYIFNVLAGEKAANDKRRGYSSWIASRNLSNKAPDAVVDALVEAVTSSYDIVAEHYNLKRVLMGLDSLADYDRYAPLPVKESEKFYTWDEARKIVVDSFAAFSPTMAEVADKFFSENWIHAPVLPNKRGGAFASPTVPSAHPFVFVNYLGRANDVMTLAHELGHGIHMYLSGQSTGLRGLYTPLTTAEMASVFAEMLVFQDLMRREDDPEVRLSMLANKIEDTFATVFRQTAMNRFEDGMHNARRTEGELPTERLNQIWLDTQRAMFGDSVELSEDYGLWWSYIPHFISTPGYVYAYAFGELLVLALYELYKERGEGFVPQYIAVLEAGGSDYPDKILSLVGVDLNDPAFWNKGIEVVRQMVQDEVALAREIYPEKFA